MIQIVRACVAAVVVIIGFAPSAQAQESIEVEGTSDFRNPPTLVPGLYRDTIVTGEAVWYAVVYTNNEPYRFEVALMDTAASEDDLSLTASFVGPTLGAVNGPEPLLEASARYSGGETNVWYLEVSLSTSGRLGVEYDFTLDVQGVQASRLDSCPELPDCTLDSDLAELDADLAAVQSNLDALLSEEAADVVGAEVDALQGEIDAADAAAESAASRTAEAEQAPKVAAAEISAICDPLNNCEVPPEPGSSTPAWALVLGIVVLLGGLALAAVQIARR